MAILYDPTDPLEIAIYKVFSKFVQQFDDSPVRLLDSNFIAPAGPYVVLKLNDIDPVSGKEGWYTQVDPVTGTQVTYNNFVGYANVYTYGSYALSRAQRIAFGTKDRNLRKLLQENGIGISNTSRVRNASRAISGTEMEERAQFSISFNFVQSLSGINSDGFIEHINTEGDLDDHSGKILEIFPSASSPDATP